MENYVIYIKLFILAAASLITGVSTISRNGISISLFFALHNC